jgi:hypothetical protein
MTLLLALSVVTYLGAEILYRIVHTGGPLHTYATMLGAMTALAGLVVLDRLAQRRSVN